MIHKSFIPLLAIICLSFTTHAQEKEASAPVQIRAVLHDPIHPVASLFYPDKTGTLVPLNFRPQDLTEALFTKPVDGWIKLYDKATIDPINPDASLAASVKLPADIKRAIIVVLPTTEKEKPAYRIRLIDDSDKAFPAGESRLLSLLGLETAIEAGEHKLRVHPGKITSLPPVKAVNEYNMAQTNFYYQHNDSWIVFAERQLQFIDNCRRLFIIHATPGALQPTVTTIVDTNTKF
jgi:hypothetical protein